MMVVVVVVMMMLPFFTLNGKEQDHNNLACCKKYLGQQPVDLIFLTTESANYILLLPLRWKVIRAKHYKPRRRVCVCVCVCILCSYNQQYRMDGMAMGKKSSLTSSSI
jgi:hypothetical protein